MVYWDRQAELHAGGIHPVPHPFEYCKEGPTSGATSLWTFYKRIFAFDPLFFRRTSQALRSTAANALYFDLPSRNPLKRQLRQTRLYLSIVLLYPSSFTSPGPVSTEVLSSFCCQEPIWSCLGQWHGVDEIYSSPLSIYHENLFQWHSSQSTDSCRTFFLSQLLS